jgi:hypothetical protein
MAKYTVQMKNLHQYVNKDTLQTAYNLRKIRRLQTKYDEHVRIVQSAITECYSTNGYMNAKFIVHTA